MCACETGVASGASQPESSGHAYIVTGMSLAGTGRAPTPTPTPETIDA